VQSIFQYSFLVYIRKCNKIKLAIYKLNPRIVIIFKIAEAVVENLPFEYGYNRTYIISLFTYRRTGD
jgi:hypothetical protein